jgi:hypothetical protein
MLVAAGAVGWIALAWRLSRGEPELPFVHFSYSRGSQPFELLGLFGGLLIVAFTAWRVRGRSLDDALPALLAGGLGLLWLGYVAETSESSWDWGCYRAAADAINGGGDIYGGCYLYPPPFAQLLAAAERLAGDWQLVFYVYQAAQVALVVVAALLCLRLVERLGVPRRRACVYVALALAVNAPLLRTLRHDQINLWVLDAVLLALVAAERWPVAAGAALAFAGYLKIYPLALVLAFALARKWRAVASAIGAVGVIAAADLALAGAAPWRAYAAFVPNFPTGTLMRDNSLLSFFFNTTNLAGAPKVAPALWGLSVLAVTIWLFRRTWLRREMPAEQRWVWNAVDLLAWQLMVAPLVWEHHYVLAVPLVLTALATAPPERLFRLAVAGALMLTIPTADMYPLSYTRLAGLVLALYWTSPGRRV